MKRVQVVPAFSVLVALCLASTNLSARDRILIVGSTTVYPFSTLVAHHFSKSGPFPPPEIHSSSTAEGFKLFCSAADAGTPDISNASRPMAEIERASCKRNGVREIAEIRIGYDSLILASTVTASNFSVTLGELWRAAAKAVPVDGKLVPNPYRSWRDINGELPDRAIRLIGPASGHGTRDTFTDLVMEPNCNAALGGLHLSSEERQSACAAVRQDGRWMDVDNLELILGKLASHPEAMGILTFSYLELFKNRIHAARINGIAPSLATIPQGTYPLSRPLYIYVNEDHLKTTTGLADYAAEFVSFCAAGAHGYLVDEGLVPLPMPELLRQRSEIARLQR
ncbi:MAG: phosphate ABC transporter substrate-binding protein [Acidobacteria bacterium]|nr:MAG: phosphate ABC transporter substrate-binding protein [Acidobacteriota bacterium]